MRVRKKQKWRWVRRETRPDPALLVQLCGFQGNSLLRHTAPSRLLQQDCHVGLPWNCPWQGRLGERCLPVSFPLHCASTGGCAQHRERASPAHRDYTSNPQPFLRKPHSASHSRVYYPVQKQPTPTGGERMPTSQSRDEREERSRNSEKETRFMSNVVIFQGSLHVWVCSWAYTSAPPADLSIPRATSDCFKYHRLTISRMSGNSW